MDSRIRELGNAIRAIVDACMPVKRQWKVKYFKRVWNDKIGMFAGVWTMEVVWAYNREGAATEVNKELRPAYNCYVTKLMPWEEGYLEEAPDDVI